MAELRALRDEVVCLRLLYHQDGNRWNRASPGIVTAPLVKGELPPPDVRFLTSASFTEGSKKTKGGYNPPQAHLLAASRMFRDFGADTAVLGELCKEYKHLEQLQKIAREGVEVHVKETPPHQTVRHRIVVLLETESTSCARTSGKIKIPGGSEASNVSGRTIHDLSYPEGSSINYSTDEDSVNKPDYNHCAAVVREILKAKHGFLGAVVHVMAGDVATALRNISIHSNSVYLFAGLIEEENTLVIELSAPFGWTGSPEFYEIFGGRFPMFTAVIPTQFPRPVSSTIIG
ncbi:hypothetical protein PC110_g17766 [Phytophthora cactorum]|uniref:Uncharacterized protein n=1 Tax=Phytophthora cactorum TaxID=29920 RepID=A0A329RN80_9STRA|nr:hypothetical protein PC110_g17766 [Phytophthora cactorum]